MPCVMDFRPSDFYFQVNSVFPRANDLCQPVCATSQIWSVVFCPCVSRSICILFLREPFTLWHCSFRTLWSYIDRDPSDISRESKSENPTQATQSLDPDWANQSGERCSCCLNWPFETTCWVSCCCYWSLCSILIPARMHARGRQAQKGLLYQNSPSNIWRVSLAFSILICVKLISIQLYHQVMWQHQHIHGLGVQWGIWHHQRSNDKAKNYTGACWSFQLWAVQFR